MASASKSQFDLRLSSFEEEPLQTCEWPGCESSGDHKAPRSRDDLHTYRWFCRDHIREYNQAWNYYAGMSDEEVENDRRHDTVWHRPSWPLGGSDWFGANNFADPFGLFGNGRNRRAAGQDALTNGIPADKQRALAILGLEAPVDVDTVKARYKDLVKRHHPDANGGDDTCQEKIKQINQAYQVVMEFLVV